MLVKINMRPSPSWNAKGENGASRCTHVSTITLCVPPTHPAPLRPPPPIAVLIQMYLLYAPWHFYFPFTPPTHKVHSLVLCRFQFTFASPCGCDRYRCMYWCTDIDVFMLSISISHSHHIHTKTKYTALSSAGSNLSLPAPVGMISRIIGVCTDI